jgi:hypothetical protein
MLYFLQTDGLGGKMKKKWWSSLRIKIIAWSFVPTLIILSTVAWFTFYSYQKVLGDLAIKQDRAIVQSKAESFFLAVQNLINPPLIPILFEIDTNRELPLETRAQNIIDHLPGINIFDGGIYFLDQQGKVFKTQPEQPELIGQDLSYTPQFHFIQENPNIGAFTDLLTIGPSGKRLICIALAMTDPNVKSIGAGYYCLTIFPVTQNA